MRSCQLSDEELAKLYRWTLHTKWGVSGAIKVSGIGADDDFTCHVRQLPQVAQGSLG